MGTNVNRWPLKTFKIMELRHKASIVSSRKSSGPEVKSRSLRRSFIHPPNTCYYTRELRMSWFELGPHTVTPKRVLPDTSPS